MKVLVAIAAVAAALVSVQAADSSSATHVSGTYSVVDLGELTCVPGDSPSILNCHTTGFVSQYSGSLAGTTTTNFDETIDCEAGRVSGHGTETFAGSITGLGSGSLAWHIRFESGFDCATFSVFNFAAKAAVFTGSGDLARVRGSFDFTIDGYTGRLTR